MHLTKADPSAEKGWYFGPWDTDCAISVGYANAGVDEPHLHRIMAEIYLMARGTAVIRVEQQSVTLESGDVIVVEPGEAHTFLSASPDHFHFVIQSPGLQGEAARADKMLLPRSRLGI